MKNKMNEWTNTAEDIADKFKVNVCYRCTCRGAGYEMGHSRDHAHTKENKVCLSMVPKTFVSFFTFLHEVGHLRAEHANYTCGVPRALAEYNATEWAKNLLKELGIPMKRKVAAAYDAYITNKIERGLRRGLKVVPSKLHRYQR